MKIKRKMLVYIIHMYLRKMLKYDWEDDTRYKLAECIADELCRTTNDWIDKGGGTT